MITAPESQEYGTIAVGIDKDKNTQQAVKWTIDNFLRGKVMPVSLVHVKVHSSQSRDENFPASGRAPSEAESQQLFLSYRGFFARKGIDAKEVVLHGVDVPSALLSYISTNSVGTFIVGASARNALMKRFKQPDVPTCLMKSAPDFCAIYVISKGKVQSSRPSNRPTGTTPPSSTSETPKSTVSSLTSSSYWTSSMRSTRSSNVSISSISSRATSKYGTPDGTPRSQDFDDSMSATSRPSFGTDTPRSTSPLPPQHSPSNNNYGRDSWISEESERPSYERSSRGHHSQSGIARSPDVRQGRGHNLHHERPLYTDGSSYSSNSSNSNNAMSSEYIGQHSVGSTNSQSFASSSFAEELEDEISRLRNEIKNAMETYQSISNQTTATKLKAEQLRVQRPDEEHTLDDLRIARDAAMVVADLERLKCKAAMDAAQLSERLAAMETKKREIAEQRAKREQDETKRVTNVMLADKANNIHYRIYTFEEIKVATKNFSESLKIGEGGYGPVYQATLQSTDVAIKVLKHDVSQGIKQFHQEIEVLGRIRHPHMVLLLGACPDHGCLVYEHMENGSLEDRLFCKNNTPPIPWTARFRIASEIATALLFLHQAKPEPMVHRDLKPANILLDRNYTSKISDVGLARLVPASAPNEMTQYHMTAAAGTFCYIDPEYQQTGMLGTKSDVYSFGVLLLQLITARPAMALAYRVEEAIELGEFPKILDPLVSDWPVEEALSLAQLALKCCELRKRDRPSLGSVVLPELIRLRDFAKSF